MSETLDALEPSTRHYFKLPGRLALLTIASFAGIFFCGGIGPCGPANPFGLVFLFGFMLLGLATVIAFAVSCGRLIASHHAHR